MQRFITVVAAGLATLTPFESAFAASDIMFAAIATGRLYVVGTTDQPHMPVVLDGQFRTESDDGGKFQYELVYHPARCIVSATIAGKAYPAVVSNCGEQCTLPAPGAAGIPQVSSGKPPSPAPTLSAAAKPGSDGPTVGDPGPPPPRSPIARPPLPPQRPSFGPGN